MIRIRTLVLAAALVGFALPVFAQGEDPAPDPAVPAADAVGDALVEAGRDVDPRWRTIHVRVVRPDETFADQPLADQRVRLHLVVPPHEVFDTREATTGPDGVARFRVLRTAGAEAWAEVDGEQRLFSDPIDLGAAGDGDIELRLWGTTADPSGVYISRAVTVLQPAEEYLIVQQVFTFGIDGPVVFRPDIGEPGPGMRDRLVHVALPDDAVGVRVIRPEDTTRVIETDLFFGGDVAPAGGDGSQQPHLIVQYSVRHENAPSYLLEQPLSMDVELASVVVPQTTEYARHPVLDVHLDVPVCSEEGAGPAGVMCFTEITDDVDDVSLAAGVDVRVARGGRAAAGDVMRVTTDGWPSPAPWRSWAGWALVLLGALAGTGLVVAEIARRRGGSDGARLRLAALLAERERLLGEMASWSERLSRGEVLEREYELQSTRIHEELGAIFRELRNLGIEPDASAEEVGVSGAA